MQEEGACSFGHMESGECGGGRGDGIVMCLGASYK